ncbi:hypothetical protein P7K49_035760 [Saguinus oedipus]|uniref:Uncharacterized protein n=1 Tax=Saguinus oedipus TaxID=9490 RepID=A0ABQ9TPA8_SAGOE|nr:hypothetical protein P7K49_035760 [Saguinus oedipus]
MRSLSPGLDLPSSLPSPMLGSASSTLNLASGCNLPLWRNSSWTLLRAVDEKDLKRLRIICGKASGPGIQAFPGAGPCWYQPLLHGTPRDSAVPPSRGPITPGVPRCTFKYSQCSTDSLPGVPEGTQLA